MHNRLYAGDAPQLFARAAYGRGEACVQLQRYQQAEQEFRRGLTLDPDQGACRRRLVDLYLFVGQRYQAAALLKELLRREEHTLDDLLQLGDLDHRVTRPAQIFAAASDPSADPLFVLGAAVQAGLDGQLERSRTLFERYLAVDPQRLDGWAAWGEVLLLDGSADWRAWDLAVSGQSGVTSTHGGLCSVRGQRCLQRGAATDACRWLARAVQQRPTSRLVWQRWGESLRGAGESELAAECLSRALELQRLSILFNDLFGQRDNPRLVQQLIERLTRLQRWPEAHAWVTHLEIVAPQLEWPRRWREKHQAHATADEEPLGGISSALRSRLQTLAAEPVSTDTLTPSGAAVAGLSPSGTTAAGTISAGTTTAGDAHAHPIRLQDAAESSGLNFVYHSGRDLNTPGARILETTGGGAGVLDYDLDGWPDLYFPQGSRTLPPVDRPTDVDCLFQNQQGQQWRDVFPHMHLEDGGFGQGVTVGDFNSDGFPDLYVAHYGVNRLYENLGDGTFRDVTPQAMIGQPVWTTSVVMVDLNQDGHPDLFDVTYCQGTDVESRICAQRGLARSCSPRVFGAAVDRLWINQGNGEWTVSSEGLTAHPGLGLGVVAFRETADEKLGLFVANDEEPNAWLHLQTAGPGGRVRWDERAVLAGLAVDGEGQTQACMGVACDDANGDGRLDLFVTNFYHESNTLYLAEPSSGYTDATARCGLRGPSWEMLGFGTQFLDLNLDGWPDLLVANGHIDDLSSLGEPYEMPVQCFRNQGGQFDELPPAAVGECLQRQGLGRGLTRLDWNCDGREDAVVVLQESPAMLLTNVSPGAGPALVLEFRSRTGAREAIGTMVTVKVGERSLTRQLTAGDGYLVSNQRQLVIGLGPPPENPSPENPSPAHQTGSEQARVDPRRAETTPPAAAAEPAVHVDAIEIAWPDGQRETLHGLVAGHHWLIIQGRENGSTRSPQPAQVWSLSE